MSDASPNQSLNPTAESGLLLTCKLPLDGGLACVFGIGGFPMGAESNGPDLLPWFWELLESSNNSLRSLCGKLEQLPKEQLRTYSLQYEEAKDFVNPCYCEEFAPYLTGDCSEDHGDDFSAWVVMQGHRFYEQVRADPASIQRYLDLFDEAERKVEGTLRWDESVDREEYCGYQRADYIAAPIYKSRFGENIDEEAA